MKRAFSLFALLLVATLLFDVSTVVAAGPAGDNAAGAATPAQAATPGAAPSEVKDSKEYQRFGPMSMRSGEAIERQMTDLVGQYCGEFISPHLKGGGK